MTQSLKNLLSGAIDYAGLFPPAELSLEESIRNYARFRKNPLRWMLGRFICPAARLKELEPYAPELFDLADPLRISALGRGGKNAEDFITGFGRDVEAIVDFEAACGGRVQVPVLETKLPASQNVAFDFDSDRLSLFLEATLAPDTPWRQTIAAAIETACSTSHGCGFKLRTGGIEAASFPSSEQIAFALLTCRQKDIPIKFTAGLHHPIRHFNTSLNVKMHGFINVLAGGVLAHAAGLDEDRLIAILEEEDPHSFTFDDESLQWKDHRATADQVREIRRQRVISFGSCSFDEPGDDLRALGWL